MVRWGMVIDLRKCIGCQACTVACKAENLTPDGVHWNRVLKTEVGKYPSVRRQFLPLPCMHCENPPCVSVCPTGASYKRPDGIVMIDYDRCVGCKYCIAACPYGVRTYVEEVRSYFPNAGLSEIEQYRAGEHKAGVVEKCTFCVHRIDNGQEPACVQTCPPHARYFGDLEDPESEVSIIIRTTEAVQLISELGTNPSVYYVPSPGTTINAVLAPAQVLPVNTANAVKGVVKPLVGAAAVVVGGVALMNMAKKDAHKGERAK
jgi:Fe-S-cluster-containing dehydrogenase component